MASKKTAMVQPAPAKPAPAKPAPAKPKYLVLEDILHQAGNTRAYTVIRFHGDTWRIHFEGDLRPSTVKLVSGKWTIVQDKD